MSEQKTTDDTVLSKISHLVHEEQGLYAKEALNDHDQIRLEAIQVELDQCWDLLRQRRAKREFGQNPDEAKIRPASVVERYMAKNVGQAKANVGRSDER
jgi:hypothetical protein